MKNVFVKMKHLLILFLVLGAAIPFCASAQISHTSNGDVDKNAQALLAKAEKKINGGPVCFTVTMVAKDASKKQTARHMAQVDYNKGKYHAVLGDQTVICDGLAIYTLSKGSNEIIVNAMSEKEDDLMNPGRLLANWQKNFRAKYIRTEKNGDAVVDMLPKKGKSYHKIRLIVGSNGILKRLEMHNYDSSEADFEVSGFKSIKVSDTLFTFDKSRYPGYEVIDMR